MSNKITESELEAFKLGDAKNRSYSNSEITVYWKPELCIHSANCIIGLPRVFRTSHRPWVNLESAMTEEVVKVVDTCPSRALTYLHAKDSADAGKTGKEAEKDARTKIQILKNGPALIRGSYIITAADGSVLQPPTEVAAICRCGASKKKPFCDGTHHHVGFVD